MTDVIHRFLTLLAETGVRDHIREIYLFGSRCRDDWRPDSDYDLLIVLDHRDQHLEDMLYEAVMDVLLETGRLISLKIFELLEFHRLRSLPSPFIQSVMTQGVNLADCHP
ncbi:MAG: nucleotidyltransferase domain-containing protein [Deltaproteobacteria bacterium]|nr:nucleotidyltransferase domain-containing protein [Deltaproteobacteria bacterium]